jgi:hypothetical protein
LWAAEKIGANRALALNVLNTPGFRLLHTMLRGKQSSGRMEVVRIEPSHRLGSLRDAVVWDRAKIEQWIGQGRRDASAVQV